MELPSGSLLHPIWLALDQIMVHAALGLQLVEIQPMNISMLLEVVSVVVAELVATAVVAGSLLLVIPMPQGPHTGGQQSCEREQKQPVLNFYSLLAN